MKDKTYTSTEVGTLVESFRNEMGVIGERVGSLCEDMADVKERLAGVEVDVRLIKDVIRIQIPSQEKRITCLEEKARLA